MNNKLLGTAIVLALGINTSALADDATSRNDGSATTQNSTAVTVDDTGNSNFLNTGSHNTDQQYQRQSQLEAGAQAVFDPVQRMSEHLSLQSSARITVANRNLSELIASSPEKEIFASTFFAQTVPLKEAVRLAESHGLHIEGFRHVTFHTTGGYILSREPIQAAMDRYNHDHAFFMEQDLKNIQGMINESATDPSLMESLLIRQRNVRERKADFERNGVRVIGLDLRGQAKILGDFKSRHALVRVVEIREQGDFPAALLPGE